MLVIFLSTVSLVNISLTKLRIGSSVSIAPLLTDQKVSISSSSFSRFFAPLLFSAQALRIHIFASSFTRFHGSVVKLSSLTLQDQKFENAHVDGNGGTFTFRDPYLEVNACLFKWNSASSDGGAIWMRNTVGSLVAKRCFFLENAAVGRGGALYVAAQNVDITDSLFDGNTASHGSHAFVAPADTVKFNDNTVIRADSNDSMAIAVRETFSMMGCLFYNNAGPLILDLKTASAQVTISKSCFAIGSCFLNVTAPSHDATIYLADSCFQAAKAEAISTNCRIVEANMSYQNCHSCYYNPNTPAATPVIRARISDPAIFAAITILAAVAIVAVVGVIRMASLCRKSVSELHRSMALSQDGYEDISQMSVLQKPFDIQ